MTKSTLYEQLVSSAILSNLVSLRDGQDCTIFKAHAFRTGDEIIYIPDLELNEVPYDRPCTVEAVNDILDICYTGDDFLEECNGNLELAERLYWYCDWQHPSSALPEVDDDEDI